MSGIYYLHVLPVKVYGFELFPSCGNYSPRQIRIRRRRQEVGRLLNDDVPHKMEWIMKEEGIIDCRLEHGVGDPSEGPLIRWEVVQVVRNQRHHLPIDTVMPHPDYATESSDQAAHRLEALFWTG